MHHKERTTAAAFTLVEIMVVLAVITVLSGLLFAVFARVREGGRTSVCASHLAQLALAMQQYVQDNNGKYPANLYELKRGSKNYQFVHWNQVLLPYTHNKAIFRCPSGEAQELADPGTKNSDGTLNARRDTSYAYNYLAVNDVPAIPEENRPTNTQMAGAMESKVLWPSTTVLNYDQPWGEHVHDNGNVLLADPETPTSSCEQPIPNANMHTGGANYSFVDGHVKWMSPAQRGEMDCTNKSQRTEKG